MPEITNISSALTTIEIELTKLKRATEHISASKEAAQITTEAAASFKNSVQAIVEPTQQLVEKIEKADFISRLEKVDSSVSATHIGIQNLQGRIDNVERSIREEVITLKESIRALDHSTEARLKVMNSDISSRHEALLSKMEQNNLELRARIRITLAVLALTLFGVIFILAAQLYL